MGKFKPNLYPNNKITLEPIDWESRIKVPNMWYVSEKLDGIRCEIHFDGDGHCKILTRSLKPFRSLLIADIAADLTNCGLRHCVVEGEMVAEGMRFNELQHFILSENVTTISARKKMIREQKRGKFPDRSLEWLCNYDHLFKIHLFDIYRASITPTFHERLHDLRMAYITMTYASDMFALVTQMRFEELDGIINYYDNYIVQGGEGLILKHEDHLYKCNRNTLPEGMVFKMKDEQRIYSGLIYQVLEGTMVDPNILTTTNELGYSRTSKKAEDRWPSGKAKGFEVDCAFGGKLTVTLKGFTDADKVELLNNKDKWVGQIIEFVAMKPTKVDGSPRQAKYIKND